MKLIAHRANTNGPDASIENDPKQIDKCIEQGYDVEIDVRYDPKTERLWLGHDTPDYPVTWWWLAGRADHLWIHCKDCLLYTSPSPRDGLLSRMPSSA